ncbi:MAG: hypothetical protein DMF73_19740 [Acidobacteria bacterium]|nr:MAG: hypothetical protein DMF73_19740 [Acidobacteriota bacterium]
MTSSDPKLTRTANSRPPRKMLWWFLHICVALLGLIWCYSLAIDSARGGIARLFCTAAIIQASVESADEAVRVSPGDPEAHYTRALSLVNVERLNEAVAEFRLATQIRPHHYYEWLDLGVTLDRLGDQRNALDSLRESVRLAPHFAQPRWQLGNLFYRYGRFEEAFTEMRLGANSNPNLFTALLDLAWVASDGDVSKAENLVRPQSRRERLMFARFLEKHGKGSDAAAQANQVGRPQEQAEHNLLREIISDLLATRRFSDAYQIWAANRSDAASSATLANGDFAEPIQNDRGFGWQVDAVPNVSASVDTSAPAGAARSVRLEFGGDSSPASQIIHQVVILRPNARHVLEFVARADNLVSGGPPMVVILDANTDARRILGQSKPITPQSEWLNYRIEFATDQNTSAVVVALQRTLCAQTPCPIFGRLWLTQFSLKSQ